MSWAERDGEILVCGLGLPKAGAGAQDILRCLSGGFGDPPPPPSCHLCAGETGRVFGVQRGPLVLRKHFLKHCGVTVLGDPC